MSDFPESAGLFTWGGLELHQDDQVHKIGTDAILLGAWIPRIIHSPKTIFDIGTGTGILSLMMAKAYPKSSVLGIDLNDSAIEIAKLNAVKAGYVHRISLEVQDVFKSTSTTQKFDLVVSNPPYYNTHNPSKSVLKNQSKHTNGPIADWMYIFLEKVAENGHCCLIVPADLAEEWIRAANDKRFYNTTRMDVYSFAGDSAPVRALLHFSQELQKPNFSRLTIYDNVNTYSLQYLEFSGIASEGSVKNNRKLD